MSLLNKISDIELADTICNKRDISLLSSLQKEMMNDLFYHSRKLASRTASIDSGYFSGWINDQLKRPMFVTDEVSEAYNWIMEYIIKKCCSYKGKASLKTYLNNVMSGPWIKAQWLEYYYKKFTRHGIVRKGTTSYIPSCIKKLSKQHQSIFVLLRRYKNEEDISQREEIELDEVVELVDDIKKQLIKAGKIELITGISSVPIDELYGPRDGNKYIDDQKKRAEDKEHIDEIQNKFNKFYNSLENMDKELLKLKYYKDFTVSDIFSFYKGSGRIKDLYEFGLASERNIYDYLDKLLGRFTASITEKKGNKKDAVTKLLEKYYSGK